MPPTGPLLPHVQLRQSIPTRSGQGFSVAWLGSQPAGIASVPLLSRTCWKAWTWRIVSCPCRTRATFRFFCHQASFLPIKGAHHDEGAAFSHG